MASRGQLLDNSPVPSTVADSGTHRTTPIGPPFLDIQENNQAAEEALKLVEDMGSQERGKRASAVVSLAKYRGLAAAADGAPALLDGVPWWSLHVMRGVDDIIGPAAACAAVYRVRAPRAWTPYRSF